jgi:hypothetical protein
MGYMGYFSILRKEFGEIVITGVAKMTHMTNMINRILIM